MAALDYTPLPLLLVPEAWNQNIRSRGGTSLDVKSKLSGGFHFVVLGVGDLRDVSFDLTLVRGDYDLKLENQPTDCIGGLYYSPECEAYPSLVAGQCSCPSEMYDDLWRKTSSPIEFFAVSMTLWVGPTDHHNEDLAWDHKANRNLFITAIDFSFKRKIRKPRGHWSRSDRLDDEDQSSS